MRCPKCKNEIQENLLKCNYCGTRIGTICKKCQTYNSIYNLNCTNCNNPLLKICPACKGINLPNAPVCRKCNFAFMEKVKEESSQDLPHTSHETPPISQPSKITPTEEESKTEVQIEEIEEEPQQEPESINLNYTAELHTQQKAKEMIAGGIMSEGKKVISLSGQSGIGKSVVLKSAINELKENQITWLLGECSALTQISPLGLIQDILLTFFNITNFCSDNLKLKKDSQRFFQSEFPTLTNDEIFNLLNLLYPTNTDYYENILINKEKTLSLLKKVFETIVKNNKTVIIIDNFQLIDGISYEFLHEFLNSDLTNNFKFLLTYDEIRPARGYLFSEKLSEGNYLDVSLNAFDKNHMESLLNSLLEQALPDEVCPSAVREKIFILSAGNPAILEQYVNLLIDFKKQNNSFEIEFPKTLNGAVEMRLNYLFENDNAHKVLSIAAIQGVKFYPSIINQILKLEENEFTEILSYLQKLNFILPVSEFSYAFKNTLLWEAVLASAKESDEFTSLNENLFAVYSNYVLSSNTLMAVIAQNLKQDLTALDIWTKNIKLASYIGDTNLYTISQKQCLVLVEKLEATNSTIIKNNIYERLGKLLSKSNPKEAMKYLPNAIANAKKLEDTLKEIELTGYLAKCCIALGDYHGTIECVNSVVSKIDESFDLEIAMLKSRKIDALLNIGNCGEIINLIDTEIMPVFDKYINAKPHKNISINSLYKTWLQTYLDLANALVLQGNNRSFEVITTLFDLFEKNNFDNKLFICKTKLALAFANTIKGDISASEEILEEIIKVYKTDIMDNETISRWNLINILNNFIHKKYTGIKEELFQVVSFANNINDNFTKNILKTLLGKLFKDEENAKHALEIYEDQITYFAKEKNAIGALLTWYFIAEANLIVEGPEKSLEISQKAMDVAHSAKINNYLFIVLYNKVIAEAFMAQGEYESAKVNIEKGILIARKFEILNQLADLYLLYGKYLQDIALVKTDAQYDYVLGASKMYKKAALIAQGIKNAYILARIDKAKTVLNSFCQLNGIVLREQ